MRAETLVRWAREIDLGSYLYLGLGERPGQGTEIACSPGHSRRSSAP